jgi:hypothetical protein
MRRIYIVSGQLINCYLDMEGVSLGTPIGLFVPNEDQRPGDYKEMNDSMYCTALSLPSARFVTERHKATVIARQGLTMNYPAWPDDDLPYSSKAVAC